MSNSRLQEDILIGIARNLPALDARNVAAVRLTIFLYFNVLTHTTRGRYAVRAKRPAMPKRCGFTFSERILAVPELPAMYVMGVYGLGAGLGFAAFGNYFGELAFFDLSGSTALDITVVRSCFKPLAISRALVASILSKVRDTVLFVW